MTRAALVLVAVLATARAAHAGGDFVMYKVQQGDGLKLIAAEYYGNRDDYIFIMTANKMDHPRVLKPGEKLKIPVNRDVIAIVERPQMRKHFEIDAVETMPLTPAELTQFVRRESEKWGPVARVAAKVE